jgi:hypothetical protein
MNEEIITQENVEKAEMKYYVYKTINDINGRFYIGVHQSKDIENDPYFGSGRNLKHAIKKYGKKNFHREILFEFDTSEAAYKKELEIVNPDFLNLYDGITYNMGEGGNGGRVYSTPPWLGRKHTEEEKHKISESNKGKIISEEQREQQSIRQKERMANLDPDVKAEIYKKMVASSIGRVMSEETRKKMSAINKGRIPSEETRQKISEANKGKGNPRLAEINKDPEKIRKTVEKVKGLYKGANSSKFSGYWITPFGKFDSKESAALGSLCSEHTVLVRCKRNNKQIITKRNVRKNSFLSDSDIGKTWKELGWGFEPVLKG